MKLFTKLPLFIIALAIMFLNSCTKNELNNTRSLEEITILIQNDEETKTFREYQEKAFLNIKHQTFTNEIELQMSLTKIIQETSLIYYQEQLDKYEELDPLSNDQKLEVVFNLTNIENPYYENEENIVHIKSALSCSQIKESIVLLQNTRALLINLDCPTLVSATESLLSTAWSQFHANNCTFWTSWFREIEE